MCVNRVSGYIFLKDGDISQIFPNPCQEKLAAMKDNERAKQLPSQKHVLMKVSSSAVCAYVYLVWLTWLIYQGCGLPSRQLSAR